MAETTVHPTDTKTSAVLAARPMTQYEALRELGCITGIDFIFLFLIGGGLVTLFFWGIFGQPTLLHLLLGLVIVGGIFPFWIILLLFRAIRFILDINAYLNTLPQEAARIVMATYSGRR